MLWQPELPERYRTLEPDELGQAIAARKSQLGSRLLVLGHHYQRDDVIRHADLIGDSLKLSRMAAAEVPRRGARTIVFCGVHFMAETADVLTPDDVPVILPDLSAGCSMADMAAYDDALTAWEEITRAHAGDRVRVVPVTYVNSSAAVKAFVGERGGACCTSGNAREVFDWAMQGGAQPLEPGERVQVLFMPDQHLGRNTARRRGLRSEVDAERGGGPADMAVWNPRKPRGGLQIDVIRQASVLLWAGHCSVHKLFRPEHLAQARHRDPGTTVIVHPECCQEVVELADEVGSTEFIIERLQQAAPGSSWTIGTEVHLVERLCRQAQARGVHARILSDCQCLCTTMVRIDQKHLLWVLDNLVEGRVVNRIQVHAEAARLARLALDRMLALRPPAPAAATVD
ncbi:MAG: putative quinolinate synthase [Planctomycetota bacterium]|jgi:quinolinate synthase